MDSDAGFTYGIHRELYPPDDGMETVETIAFTEEVLKSYASLWKWDDRAWWRSSEGHMAYSEPIGCVEEISALSDEEQFMLIHQRTNHMSPTRLIEAYKRGGFCGNSSSKRSIEQFSQKEVHQV